MNELVFSEYIKIPEIPDKVELMVFDDASIIMMHTDTAKNNTKYPINLERWDYDDECCDYFVRGKPNITQNINYKSINILNKMITNLVEQYDLFN